MPITEPQGMREAVSRRLAEQTERVRREVVRNLSYVGEETVNEARKNHTYTDQTGNLTSSMGYVVILDGEVVNVSGFQTVDKGSEGSAGGREYALSLVSRFPKGAALIVVAGMDYASYVAAKGYNVLDSARLLAEREVPKLLAQLGITQ